ncbi:MAG: molecular chaperone HscC [Lachnospiraceae bacterium]
MSKIIGIDLGTTNSLAAVWQNGKSVLIPNSFGEYLTPSVVSMGEENTVYVGRIAKERLISHPEYSVSVFKRFMGTEKTFRLGEKIYRPEELSAFVLRRLKEDAERYLGEAVEEAVVSVPAYFNDMARKATKTAGELAGLKVERIINEPSAAALAYHIRNKEEDETFLVFDFGGGTLDVSLVDCFDNIIEIVSVSGDNRLGGSDFDREIAGQFCKEHGMDFTALTPKRREIILESANRAKCALTENVSVVMQVSDEDFTGQMELNNKKLIQISMLLFQRMSVPVKKVMRDGDKNMLEISKVILVGGSCKMPSVKQYLCHMAGECKVYAADPDHMVALGVGVYAGIKERQEDIKDMLLTDICPFTLGTGIYNEADADRPIMSAIIERNSVLPCSKVRRFCTAGDFQCHVKIDVYQGEEYYADHNICLGVLDVDVPMAPKGKETVSVRYTYDINGILIVDVKVDSTGEKVKEIITTGANTIEPGKMEQYIEELEKLKLHPAEQEENQMMTAWGERLFAQASGDLREELGGRIRYFQHLLLTEQDAYKIKKWKRELEIFFLNTEKYLGGTSIYGELEDIDSWYHEDENEELDEDLEEEYRLWYDGHLTH